ncbi:MAG: acetylornithine/succinylornithine family transaminase [Ruminococcaceae bacterium]|nr:acetylornithine/succinylornithine family transaminase [Oscillospiraceae bacterium]
MNSFAAIDKNFVANTYNRFPLELVRGENSTLFDINGKEYIDMGSGIGVTAFGFNDEVWKNAVTEQLSLLQHTSNLYFTEPCAKLASVLCEKTGMKKVFFGNSGAEANECAIKTARKYAADKKGSDYYTIITLENSFHGRTVTTLAATGQAHYHELFNPLTDGFVHTPANDLDKLIKTANSHKTAAIMIECIQGEGGVNVLDEAFVKGVYDFAKENDILLIVDEVQTGNGRTGKMYAYIHYGIKPDIVTTAKGLGGGLPIGAVLFGEKTENVLGFGEHGSTFGGNPVCCAGALSIVERLDEKLFADIVTKSKYIFDELSSASGVISVCGKGLMIGIKPVKNASDVLKICMENGVLCLTAKDKLRLLPALNIPMESLIKAVGVIKDACKL